MTDPRPTVETLQAGDLFEHPAGDDSPDLYGVQSIRPRGRGASVTLVPRDGYGHGIVVPRSRLLRDRSYRWLGQPLESGERVHYPDCPDDLGTVERHTNLWVVWDDGHSDPIRIDGRLDAIHDHKRVQRVTEGART